MTEKCIHVHSVHDEEFGKLVTNGCKELEALGLTVDIHCNNVLLSNGYVQLSALLIGKRI